MSSSEDDDRMEEYFDAVKRLLNEPDVRLYIAKQFSNPCVHDGGTFWFGKTMRDYKEVTGKTKKLQAFITAQVSKALRKRPRPYKIMIDLASSTVGASHYVTLMLDLENEYAAVFDTGVCGGSDSKNSENTYDAARRKLYPIMKQWLRKNAGRIFPETKDVELHTLCGDVCVQRTVDDTLCQTYVILFRDTVRGNWDKNAVKKWMSKLIESPEPKIGRVFRRIVKLPLMQRKLVVETESKESAKLMATATNKFLFPDYTPPERKARPQSRRRKRNNQPERKARRRKHRCA
jgi:hypothetical protein